MKLGWIALLVFPLAGAGALATNGCSNQGEGERCSLDNPKEGEDSDCAEGLVCTDVEGVSAHVCCPKTGQPTELACIPSGGTGGDTTSGSGGSTSGSGGSGGAGGSGGSGGAGGTGGSGGAGGTGGI